MKPLALILALSACTATAIDAGCNAYGEARITMPRQVPNDALGAWVATLDSRMTGTCR